MLHFGRRGRENLSSLTRKHFAVKRGADDKLYVYKVIDEQTKNHQSDSELSSDGRMYEITDGERCPVKSFVKYIRRLNPKCVKLFQQARSYPKEGVYYDNIPLGHNRLGQFMNEISKMANLSHIYTNHSCRATTVHLLDEADIPSRHIMTVTGHKSETSLKTYSGKTCEKKKRHMSEILSSKTCGKKSCISNIDFLCLSQSTITVEANEGVENIPVELSDANFDLELLSIIIGNATLNDLFPVDSATEIEMKDGTRISFREFEDIFVQHMISVSLIECYRSIASRFGVFESTVMKSVDAVFAFLQDEKDLSLGQKENNWVSWKPDLEHFRCHCEPSTSDEVFNTPEKKFKTIIVKRDNPEVKIVCLEYVIKFYTNM
ncbi:unnamed protein product [Mytilus edulis]|uniref:Tyr recombinase domain-containing protein n=1 Tax=Mytilus edulis TaxID=6550 RepID=A0A8S3SG90_MYTED|nr:unnamed protein product [Mytilus edulis]